MEPSENKNEIKEEKKPEQQTQEKKEENIINNNPPQPQPQKEEPQIQTFQLGDERHPVDPDAEISILIESNTIDEKFFFSSEAASLLSLKVI